MAKQPTKKDDAQKEGGEAPDSPLLDLSDAAVKKMIKLAKKRGFVTLDQVNEVLPSESTTTEQIEDIMSMFSEMGVNVVEKEEVEEGEGAGDDDEADTEVEAADGPAKLPVKAETRRSDGMSPVLPISSGTGEDASD